VTSVAGPVGPAPATLWHLRLRFTKLGKVRFISHRDVARVWERALRRAGLPVAYSGGFSPHPLLSFGLALPTGCESTAEYLDVALVPDRPVEDDGWVADLASRADSLLGPHLPEGIGVVAAAPTAAGGPSLQQVVTACTWRIELPPATAADVHALVARAMAAATLPVARERKGQHTTEDVRPALLDLRVIEDGERPVLIAETATRPRGVRPSELADALGAVLGTARRIHQWIDCDGSRWEPIVTGPASALVAQGSPS